MKSTIRHGAIVRCDMVTVVDTKDELVFKSQCEEVFITYSVSSLARAQAANADWTRPKVKLVKWPGQPPMEDGRKVDLCPDHAHLVMTPEEAKAKRKAEREKAKAAKKAAKAAQPKKPRKPRKPKAEVATA